MSQKRKKAIVRRRIFLAFCVAVLIAAIVTVTTVAILIKSAINDSPDTEQFSSTVLSSSELVSSEDISSEQSTVSEPEYVELGGYTLDASFSRLLLINGENPLPDDYDANVREYLVEIPDQYRNNDYVTQIHRDVLPYITAMVANAQADGVNLQVWSPFRSYSIQNDLFQKQVERAGGDETLAATVVARPGTSEHNTGLCADFNMASDAFETTPMYTWMCEHAENYGFILRYPADKTDITGVIYESWHWRFVGINAAKEINELGLTLEEYIEYKNLEPTVDMYGDDSVKDTAERIVD